jgi:hypothetical protein
MTVFELIEAFPLARWNQSLSEVLNEWTEEQLYLFILHNLRREKEAKEKQEQEGESESGNDRVDWNQGENW